MFDKIVQFIIDFIADILPFFIVYEYEGCVHYRVGKVLRVVGAGFWWKIPFFDNPYKDIVVTTTERSLPQSVITKDKKTLVVAAIIKYNIKDLRTFAIAVTDGVDAIIDVSMGHTMNIINGKTLDECYTNIERLSRDIEIVVRRDVKKYGIEVEVFTIIDLVEAPAFRLFHGESQN